MKKIAADEKWIGGDLPGFFGVLHTWGRTLQYPPHIHYVVTGGAISKGGQDPCCRISECAGKKEGKQLYDASFFPRLENFQGKYRDDSSEATLKINTSPA